MKLRHRRSLRGFSYAALAIVASAWADPSREAAALDSPYVEQAGSRDFAVLSVGISDSGIAREARQAKLGDEIQIPAVGRLPSFRVTLRSAAIEQPDTLTAPPSTPLFIVADTHGEYEILSELLQRHRIIDASLRWSFGKGHLVFLGDVFDRGPNQTEILWLIYKLEAEAKKAGGGVHLVLGNHEVMALTGDLRYLNPKYIQTAQALGVDSYSALFGPRTVLGQWLRTKPAVLKLNDLLCLHGGISRAVIDRKLSPPEINATVRRALRDATMEKSDERAALVMGKLGPLWYRGYFADQPDFPPASADDVEATRKYYGVSTLLVGHTVVPTVTPLYGGKVIAVQVYPHRDDSTHQPVMEALRIERGKFFRAKIDGSTEPLQ